MQRSDKGTADFEQRWTAVVEWFGYKPSFHDAEILSIDLRRAPERSVVRVHAWRTLEETDERGCFQQDRHAVVSIVLKDILSQELSGWNYQNVLSRLDIADGPDGATLTLDQSHGIEGKIVAREITLEIEPRV